jgi:hypothetical protein
MGDAKIRLSKRFEGRRLDRRLENLERATHQPEMGRTDDRGMPGGEVAERTRPHRNARALVSSVEARPKAKSLQQPNDHAESLTCLSSRFTQSRRHEPPSARFPCRLDRPRDIASAMGERIDQDLCQQPKTSLAARQPALDDAVAMTRPSSGARADAFLDHEARTSEHAKMPAHSVRVQADALRESRNIQWP